MSFKEWADKHLRGADTLRRSCHFEPGAFTLIECDDDGRAWRETYFDEDGNQVGEPKKRIR